MIHDGVFSMFLWKNILHASSVLETNYALLFIILVTLSIFIIGAVVDLIRKLIEKYTVSKLLDIKKIKSLINKANKYINE
jgi:hypothetical protein